MPLLVCEYNLLIQMKSVLIGTMTWEQRKHPCFDDTQKFVSQVPTTKEYRTSENRLHFTLRCLTSDIDIWQGNTWKKSSRMIFLE